MKYPEKWTRADPARFVFEKYSKEKKRLSDRSVYAESGQRS